MKPMSIAGSLFILSMLLLSGCTGNKVIPPPVQESVSAEGSTISLPSPRIQSQTSVEAALLTRRSVRTYSDAPLTLPEAGQLLWAAQGITDPNGFRTAPSAGALYPLELYLVVKSVDRLSPGIYHYLPTDHQLRLLSEGEVSDQLSDAALRQSAVKDAPVVIVFSAVPERTTARYGERGMQYVFMEAGHAAQNVCLQAVALDLGTVTIGAFDEDEVRTILNLPEREIPLYLLPVGRP
ncbi:MAG: Coenzyme F420:L-glutamate ligase [Euryarchaeota archaeon ADurb.BinA087]|nr:MAG: Coenzyme F420:L-glutamate ligase [Euryarchaeota archaeon ADurb.BinA087]